MATVHQLRFEETGRSVDHVAQTPQSGATWEVHDLLENIDNPGYLVASGSAVHDATSLVLALDASPSTANPRRLFVASTTNVVVGSFYRVSSTSGSEIVQVEGLSTDTYIDLADPIVGDYTVASGALIEGLRMSTLLPDSIAATEDYVDFDEPLRIVWRYSNNERHQQQMRVVRQDFDDFDPAFVIRDCKDLFADLGTRTQHNGHDTLPRIVNAFYRQERAQKLASGDEPERYLHGEQGHWTLVWGVLLHEAAKGNAPGQEDTEVWFSHCTAMRKKFYQNTRGKGLAGSRTASIEPQTESAPARSDIKRRAHITFG